MERTSGSFAAVSSNRIVHFVPSACVSRNMRVLTKAMGQNVPRRSRDGAAGIAGSCGLLF